MIPTEPDESRVDCDPLDRLVDDELPESDRGDLLRRLESEPGGWRRCALAFLEAQSWRKELSAMAGERSWMPEPTPVPKASRPPRRTTGKLAAQAGTVLAMAASFVVALWLGRAVLDLRNTFRPSGPGPAEIASSVPAIAAPESIEPAAQPAQRPVSPSGPWQMVTLSADGPNGQSRQSFDLPACERQRLDSNWTENLAPALPRDVLESLERTGYRVRQHRELMPIEMMDGRRLVVPVEAVEVEYAGQPSL
ncbi:MAG: hypothetical protein U1E05_15460 [Patescibacteria group bacterium]|nr:hypothetical protein [Patescibacteria group bacterium]